MKAKPILFSAPMIRALLNGSKTQTRRIIKAKEVFISASGAVLDMADGNIKEVKFPYGEEGGYLWAKESYWIDKTTKEFKWYVNDVFDIDRERDHCKMSPSIFMPRNASRLTLKMTGLRVERLQDISNEDCFAEGIDSETNQDYLTAEHYLAGGSQISGGSAERYSYACLWRSINGEGSWDLNPWVWVIEFDVIKQNVDSIMSIYASTDHGNTWDKIQAGSK